MATCLVVVLIMQNGYINLCSCDAVVLGGPDQTVFKWVIYIANQANDNKAITVTVVALSALNSTPT